MKDQGKHESPILLIVEYEGFCDSTFYLYDRSTQEEIKKEFGLNFFSRINGRVLNDSEDPYFDERNIEFTESVYVDDEYEVRGMSLLNTAISGICFTHIW